MFCVMLIQFNFSLLFSFLIGIGVVIAIFALIYLIIFLTSINRKNRFSSLSPNTVSDEEVKQIIEETKMIFKDKKLKSYKSNIVFCKDLSYELIVNIAKKFYPESKHPLFELSIDEVLMLTMYISNRLDEIFDARFIRMFKKIKVSQIIGMAEIKEKIEANSIVKATKKYKIKEALSATKKVINIVNPVKWAQKAIINTSTNFAIKKLCLIVISIVGEETYKIYSKAVFDSVVEIDTGVSLLVDEVNSELEENASDEEIALDNDNLIASEDDLPKKNDKKGIFRNKKK